MASAIWRKSPKLVFQENEESFEKSSQLSLGREVNTRSHIQQVVEVTERERERVCVCVCARERESERRYLLVSAAC